MLPIKCGSSAIWATSANMQPDTVMVGKYYILGKAVKTTPDKVDWWKQGELLVSVDGVIHGVDLANEMYQNSTFSGIYHRSDTDSHEPKEDGFNYFESWEEMEKMFKSTPKAFVYRDGSHGRITDQTQSGNEVLYDKTGDYLDLDRYLSGEPDYFGVAALGLQPVRLARILICGDTPAYTKAADIRLRSRLICKLTDWMEQNNYRCRLDIVFACECSVFEVKIKDYYEQLCHSDVGIATNPDYFRRVSFVFTEYSDTYRFGYGKGDCLNGIIFEDTDADLTITISDSYNKLADRFEAKRKKIAQFDWDNSGTKKIVI